MIYKKDYNELAKNIHDLMQKYNASQDKYGAYYINTFCGEMRIHLDDFKPKRDYIWIFTRVEHPEKVIEPYCDGRGFNKFSGKYNMCSDDIHFIYSWLRNYVVNLTLQVNYA